MAQQMIDRIVHVVFEGPRVVQAIVVANLGGLFLFADPQKYGTQRFRVTMSRIFTSAFAHVDEYHLISNMAALAGSQDLES